PLCNPMAGGHWEVVGQGTDIHFKVLGSPSGQAHAEVFGVSFAYVLHSSGGSVITPANEIWLLNPDGQIAIRLLQGSGTNVLDCVEHPDVGVYLEAVHSGTQMVFSPTFGGHGTLESGLEIGCIPGYCAGQISGDARSLDVDDDGDCDEDDENIVRANLGSQNFDYDFNWARDANGTDLGYLINEEKRGQKDGGCPDDPYVSTNYHMFPPSAPVVTLTVLNSTTTRLSWPAVADDPTGPGASHEASGYEVRRSSAPITD